MMKKLLMLLSLLVIALFVVSCTPKESADGEEGTLAGQAIQTKLSCNNCIHVATLDEGESAIFPDYNLKLNYIDDQFAKFEVNGEVTAKIKVGDTYTLTNGNKIGVLSIFYQTYAGGIHQAKVCVR